MGSEKLSGYPKIYNLGHPAIDYIFSEPVVVEEKLDGSQLSFGVFNGKLKVRSKGAKVDPHTPDKNFNKALTAIKELAAEGAFQDGWIYRGESMRSVKPNVLAYDREPKGNFVIFDIEISPNRFLSRPDKEKEVERIGFFELVPCLHYGMIYGEKDLRDLIDRKSFLGSKFNIEGCVFKNYHRFGRDGHPLFGKYVSAEFREVHKKVWTKKPKIAQVATIAESYGTHARWEKAIQHLRDEGKLTGTVKDIGPLCKEVQNDVDAEGAEPIGRMLYNDVKKEIMRRVVRGLPEWYKGKLAAKQFEEE